MWCVDTSCGLSNVCHLCINGCLVIGKVAAIIECLLDADNSLTISNDCLVLFGSIGRQLLYILLLGKFVVVLNSIQFMIRKRLNMRVEEGLLSVTPLRNVNKLVL